MEYIYANPGWTAVFLIIIAMGIEFAIKAWRGK